MSLPEWERFCSFSFLVTFWKESFRLTEWELMETKRQLIIFCNENKMIFCLAWEEWQNWFLNETKIMFLKGKPRASCTDLELLLISIANWHEKQSKVREGERADFYKLLSSKMTLGLCTGWHLYLHAFRLVSRDFLGYMWCGDTELTANRFREERSFLFSPILQVQVVDQYSVTDLNVAYSLFS